jgi:hypothetical protein
MQKKTIPLVVYGFVLQNGATTLSITTLSIKALNKAALSIVVSFATLSITTS